jgi:2-succinyl-5-enolpyruvyl-6-hydroxy-3-cyclohexene-1-carboxylate synthase
MSTPGDIAATFCATLADEWARDGIQHAVIAPGSRSTPLALALISSPKFQSHVFHDERSAAFAALGIGLSTGVPAVLLCTSGTAAAHFHAAVIEAHQSNVPMIVCTADRPPELRDIGAPQTIDQTNLYGSAVRWFHDPGVPSLDAKHTWRALASRCVSLSTTGRPGPVHLNLPFRDPLIGDVGDLPPVRQDSWVRNVQSAEVSIDDISALAQNLSERRGVIVAGNGATADVLTLADALQWPVFADPRSGLRECVQGVVIAFDPILRAPSVSSDFTPDVVLRVGEPPASKVLAQWVAASGAEVIQIQPHEGVIDPDHLTHVSYVGNISRTCGELATRVKSVDSLWRSKWQAAETSAQRAISEWTKENFSEPSVVRAITDELSPGTNLVVSSSMPIRDVEWFGTVTPGVKVYSNRGANGIDGVVSTAVGIAIGSNMPTNLLIGDVAFLHDINGLIALPSRNIDLNVLVTNNDGGSIFSFLPQGTAVDTDSFEKIYGTPHGVVLRDLASAYGLHYIDASNEVNDAASAVSRKGCNLVEIRCDRGVNVGLHNQLNDAVVEAVEATV